MTLSPTERAELRKLCEKATEGPWLHGWPTGEGRAIDGEDGGYILHPIGNNEYHVISNGGNDDWSVEIGIKLTADADFIAASRTAIPAILDALDSAEARHESFKNRMKEILSPEWETSKNEVLSDGNCGLHMIAFNAVQHIRDAKDAAGAECERMRQKMNAAEAENQRLRAELVEMEKRKDAAYYERNQVVAGLAAMATYIGHTAGIAKTAIEGWSEDWHGCVYIDLPTGQVSWHYHDSQAGLFDFLPAYTAGYDGHDTPEKYRRVAALATMHAALAKEVPHA